MPWQSSYGGKRWNYGGHGGGARANGRVNGYGTGGGSKWWTCSIPGCVASLKAIGYRPQVNKPGTWECVHCALPWDFLHTAADIEKEKAKEALKVVVAQGPAGMTAMLSKTQQKRLEANPSGDTIIVVAAGSGDEEEDAEGNSSGAAETVLALPPDYTKVAPLLKMPPPLDDTWSPEKAVAKFLPKKSKVDVGKLQEDLVGLQQLLVVQEKKLVPATEAEVTATKKKIEVNERKTAEADVDSALALAASELDVSIKQHARSESARSARFEESSEKAEKRADTLEAICLAQLSAWETHLADIRADRTVRSAAWLARRLEVESRVTQEEEHLKAKLQEAQARGGEAAAPANSNAVQVNLTLQDTKAEVVQLQQEKQALADRLEALEKLVAAQQTAQPQAAAQLTLEAAAQCHKTVTYVAAELPELKQRPNEAYKKQLVLLRTNLQLWATYGRQPVTYEQLLTGAGDQKATSGLFRILQDVAGETLWKRFYGEEVVTDGQLVPCQMREVLLGSLAAADTALEEYAKLINYEKEAKTCFQKIHEADANAKRTRTGPYSD